jgi:hypothetical protein
MYYFTYNTTWYKYVGSCTWFLKGPSSKLATMSDNLKLHTALPAMELSGVVKTA